MSEIIQLPAHTSIDTAVQIVAASSKARDIFHRNSDTLIAGYLVRHPDTDPADVELVFTPETNGTIRFSIEPKELHVPAAIGPDTPNARYIDNGYRTGWNECRAAMIAQAKSVRAPEAMVSTLEAADV